MWKLALLSLLLAGAGCAGDPDAGEAPPAAAPAPAPAGPAGATGPASGQAPEAAPGLDLPDDLRVVTRITPPEISHAVADGYTRLFYEGKLDELFAKFSSEMKATIPLAQLEQHHARFVGTFGKEREVVQHESKDEDGYRAFVRWARFEKHDGVVGIQWILREDDAIAGFYVRQAAEPQPPPAN